MRDPTPSMIVLVGVVGLLAYWIANRRRASPLPMPGDPDYWSTPFYLRANTPVFGTSMAIMPSVPGDSYFIGQGWALPTFFGGS